MKINQSKQFAKDVKKLEKKQSTKRVEPFKATHELSNPQ